MSYSFKTKPYDHQLLALKKSWNREAYGLFMEMGTGKSKVLIDTIGAMYETKGLTGALIVAPKGVYKTWINQEIPKHMPDHLPVRVAYWTPGPNKDELFAMNRLMEDTADLCIFVMNVEALSTKKGAKAAEHFLLAHRAMFAIDESTTIKTPTAKRTLTVLKLAPMASWRRILTGTPMTNSPMDLYSQFAFLGPDLLGFSSFYTFRARYALMERRSMGPKKFMQIIGFQNLEELQEIIEPHSYRVLKSECLDLPEKVYEHRNVELSVAQKLVYKEMKEYAVATAGEDGGAATVTVILTQLLRLHQITCGYLKTDDGIIHPLANNRLTELLNVLEETTGKVVIWATYRHNIEAIVEAIRKAYGPASVVHYYGDTTEAERESAVLNFSKKDSGPRFFVGNPATGGKGITLVSSSTVIYYSNDYNLESRLQSEDRTHRIGQVESVTYIDLITSGIIDEKIVDALRNKKNLASLVIGDEWQEWI